MKIALGSDHGGYETKATLLRLLADPRRTVADLKRQVAELEVRAPVGGLVSRLDVQDHDPVTTGQPLVAVVDLSAFEIEVMIPESYADEVGPGFRPRRARPGERSRGRGGRPVPSRAGRRRRRCRRPGPPAG